MKYGYNSDERMEMIDKVLGNEFGTSVGCFWNAYSRMMKKKTFTEKDEIALKWMTEMVEELNEAMKTKKKVEVKVKEIY